LFDTTACRNYLSSRASPELYSSSVETETNSDGTHGSSYDNIESFNRDSRAGEDGYSLLRRPVSFDADADPTFDAPLVLDEREEELLMDANKNWYEERSGGRRTAGNKKDRSSKNGILGEYADVLQISHDDSSEKNKKKLQASTRQNEEDQQLDMHRRTLETLDYPLVLRALANECSTMRGKEIVANSHSQGKNVRNSSSKNKDVDDDMVTMPLTASSVAGVHHRFGAVQEMQRLMEGRVSGWVTSSRQQQQGNNKGKKKVQRKPLGAPPIDGHSFDLGPIFDIVDDGKVLEGPEILDITTMLEIAYDVKDWARALKDFNEEEQASSCNDLKQDPFVDLPRLTQSIKIDDELFHLLTNTFDDEGKLSGTTFPGIGRLRAKVRTYKRDIMSSIESILSLPSMKSKLAVESGGSLIQQINGRLVIPVQQQYTNSVGIAHDASRSGKTAYVEPTEVVGPTNELRQAEAELRAEEARVWRQLTEMIVLHRDEIERNVASIGQLDVTIARVKLGNRLGGVVPTVAEDGVISVKEARHPILLLRGLEGVVGSDVEIGQDGIQGLILTGPNSGGKTIVLKLLGLYAFMVRDGIPVPSKAHEPARVDFFAPILADIGDIQSVDGDLSTFSGHMLVCREVLANADKNALVLMDELGSGTDPNQGVAIAQAILEALLDRNCRVAITTHYLELKQLASTDDRFAVAGMQFRNGKPTYKLLPGVIGESFALAVAERLKLPTAVIERAYALLDTETRQMGELIRDLEDQKLLVEEKADELRKREYEMRELKAEMKRQQERLEAKQLNARREEAKKFAAKLEEKEKLLEDILLKLKGSGASKKVIADR
jgi:DNA mismatch repair protein MutS2